MDHRYFVSGEPDNFLLAFNSKAYQSSLLFDTIRRGCLKQPLVRLKITIQRILEFWALPAFQNPYNPFGSTQNAYQH